MAVAQYNDNTDTGGGSITNVIVGLVFTVLGVAYSAMSTANQVNDTQAAAAFSPTCGLADQ